MIYKNLFFRALLVGMAGLIAGCDSFKVDDSNSLRTGTLIFIKTDVRDLFDYMNCIISSNVSFKRIVNMQEVKFLKSST